MNVDVKNNDHFERRCPRLGGPVRFQYCRETPRPGGDNENKACFKIFDCWWEYFDVVAFMKEILPEDRFEELAQSKPKPKVASLFELIEQAKARTENK